MAKRAPHEICAGIYDRLRNLDKRFKRLEESHKRTRKLTEDISERISACECRKVG